eukprot:GILJ01011190.1.p1 GENE.GILJ01011190.1~~GILJ01011190.1.p1  ORF type:complete len:1118 (-),score=193.95 GILJ01011190.1:97-3414(-)
MGCNNSKIDGDVHGGRPLKSKRTSLRKAGVSSAPAPVRHSTKPKDTEKDIEQVHQHENNQQALLVEEVVVSLNKQQLSAVSNSVEPERGSSLTMVEPASNPNTPHTQTETQTSASHSTSTAAVAVKDNANSNMFAAVLSSQSISTATVKLPGFAVVDTLDTTNHAPLVPLASTAATSNGTTAAGGNDVPDTSMPTGQSQKSSRSRVVTFSPVVIQVTAPDGTNVAVTNQHQDNRETQTQTQTQQQQHAQHQHIQQQNVQQQHVQQQHAQPLPPLQQQQIFQVRRSTTTAASSTANNRSNFKRSDNRRRSWVSSTTDISVVRSTPPAFHNEDRLAVPDSEDIVVIGDLLDSTGSVELHKATWRGMNLILEIIKADRSTSVSRGDELVTSVLCDSASLLAADSHPNLVDLIYISPYISPGSTASSSSLESRERSQTVDNESRPHAGERFVLSLFEEPGAGTLGSWIGFRRLYRGSQKEVIRRILQIAIQVAEALQHLHTHNIVHFDVRAENVWMHESGKAKIFVTRVADYKNVNSSSSGSTDSLFSTETVFKDGGLSPRRVLVRESISKTDIKMIAPINPHADLLAWGLLVLHMLGGNKFWRDGALQQGMDILNVALSNPNPNLPPISPDLVEILCLCLKTPENENRTDQITMTYIIDSMKSLFQKECGEPFHPLPGSMSMLSDMEKEIMLTVFGEHLQRRHLLDDAMQVAKKAVRFGGEHIATHILLADLYMEAHLYQEAVDSLHSALQIEPRHTHALLQLGNACRALRQFDAAIVAYKSAIQERPPFIDVLYCSLGIVLRASGRLDDAIAAYSSALTANPGYAMALFNLANAMMAKDRVSDAISLYRDAIHLKPDYVQAYMNLGNALQSKGDTDEAISMYREAIRLNPIDPIAFSNLGNALHSKGDFEEAVRAHQEAVELNPDDAVSNANLALTLLRTGKLEEGIAATRKSVQLDPTTADAHFQLGCALFKHGDIRGAHDAFTEALKLDNSHAKSLFMLGRVHQHTGAVKDAILLYRDSLKADPNDAQVHLQLGVALASQGLCRDAIVCYHEAIRLLPHNVEVYVHMGTAMCKLGNKDGAKQAFEDALRLDATNPLALKMLETLN